MNAFTVSQTASQPKRRQPASRLPAFRPAFRTMKSVLVPLFLFGLCLCAQGFTTHTCFFSKTRQIQIPNYAYASFTRFMSEQNQNDNNVILELADDTDDVKASSRSEPASKPSAPFLSQGEILPESLNPDLSDPKQARVIIYIIISLVPVLFLIPLMLGSRDLIPLDDLPPVQM